MAKILNKEPAVYRQEQENFVRELRKFHEQKGEVFKIKGVEIFLVWKVFWGFEKVLGCPGRAARRASTTGTAPYFSSLTLFTLFQNFSRPFGFESNFCINLDRYGIECECLV